MSAGKTDKPLRIKGLVKRCRSFKEDILSRLARNRSLGKEDSITQVKAQSSSANSDGESPIPTNPASNSSVTPEPPHVSLPHRLKEANLTLSFVESLIQKNCVDLLGGSSNVMLDLMGCLLNEVKKSSASGSAAYQSAISQVKSTLSDFLTAVDVLVLKDRCDDAQREVFFGKVLETLRNIREALMKLKTLVESKENGHANFMGSTPVLTSISGIQSSPSKKSESSSFNPPNSAKESDEKRPPLPPKLKQWTAKSFDLGFQAPRATPSSPLHQIHQEKNPNTGQIHNTLLNQWLEQSSLNNNNTINNSAASSSHHCHSQSSPSTSQDPITGVVHVQPRLNDDVSRKTWTDSSVYVARSSSASLSNNTNSNTDSQSRNRTFSDSLFGLGETFTNSEDSLDHFLPEETRSRATTHSQSLSLGSSLDNLLLVDSQSQHSGLSPNSMHKMSTSSYNAGSGNSPSGLVHGHELAGLQGLGAYDPDADGDVFVEEVLEIPEELPELPKKTRHFVLGGMHGGNLGNHCSGNGNERCPSPYDNVIEEGLELSTWHGERGIYPQSSTGSSIRNSFQTQRQFMSYSESRNTLVGVSGFGGDVEEKPPLPPKKKHSITAYVELMHNWDTCSSQNHHHHHFHNHQSNHVVQQQNQSYHFQGTGSANAFHSQYRRGSATLHNPSTGNIPGGGVKAAYAHSTSYHHFSSFSSTATSIFAPMSEGDTESSPSKQLVSIDDENQLLGMHRADSGGSLGIAVGPPVLPPKKSKNKVGVKKSVSEHEQLPFSPYPSQTLPGSPTAKSPIFSPTSPSTSGLGALTGSTPIHSCISDAIESPQLSLDEDNLDLYIFDGSPNLVLSESVKGKSVTEGPEVKGGEPFILLVYAASPNLQDVKFREVFLLTYRTFLRPLHVVSLLWRRYQYFEKKTNDRISVVHGRATLDLLVDVINSLTPMDMDDDMITKVRGFIYHLVNAGEILSALKARRGLILKYEVRVQLLSPKPVLAALAVTVEPQSLLQWGATSIAQQMTVLDSELFRHLEPAELLLWAREQSEDFCPALNNFTEHFNKVSYWARSKVLLCATSRERNRTMKKLIEVMRKLREYSNFNSLLAVLAALDSAPIRRLGFSRRLTEALKPHAALTDSSGSFRTYRQALAESKPPCIPYIGLVLQDLTFVHIGNADFLADGKVNWIKRWQQWVVLEPIRRFHSCQYGYIRNDSLLTFLNNFDESLNDDDLWQLSEAIKPRGKS